MVYLLVGLLGVISWRRLPQELFPEVSFPQLTVVTRYPNAAPEEIENLITKVVEESIATVKNLHKVTSTSKEGLSLVTAEFNWGTNMDFAALNMRDKIDIIKDRLPLESEEPVVMKYNPFELPILILSVTGSLSKYELLKLSKQVIKDGLEKVPGVASATISGGEERQILVEVDQSRLAASRIGLLTVVESLKNANVNYPAGTTKEKVFEYMVRTVGEFKTVDEIKDVSVAVDTQESRREKQEYNRSQNRTQSDWDSPETDRRLILLGSVADVNDTFREPTSYSRTNGKDTISLSVQKQSEANTIQTVDGVRKALEKMKHLLPPDVDVRITYDQSSFIKSAIQDVNSAAFQGGVLSVLVLIVFLKKWKEALIVSMAIPTSILAIFSAMQIQGISLNMMSMGGLALGLGMLTDCAIVVVENIDRHKQLGLAPQEAAIIGTEEVVGAVTSSTLTNIVVFVPLIFVVGITGQIFKDLAWTVTYTNMGSLLASFTLIPQLYSRKDTLFDWPTLAAWRAKATLFFREGPFTPVRSAVQKVRAKIPPAWIHWVVTFDIDHYLDKYKRVLRFFGERRRQVALSILGLFIASVAVLFMLDREFLPKVDQRQFLIKIDMPSGTRLDITNGVALEVERALRTFKEVKVVTTTVGSSAENKLESLGSHQAQIIVDLWKSGEKPKGANLSTGGLIQEVKKQLSHKNLGQADIQYHLQESVFASFVETNAPVVLEVKGHDMVVLKQLAQKTMGSLEKIPGVFGVKSTLADPSPEERIRIDKDKAAAYHLSTTDIARTALIAVKGTVATKFREEGKEYDVLVRLRTNDLDETGKLRGLMIHSPLDVDIPLAEVATLTKDQGPSEIKRVNQQRTILVTANVFNRSIRSVQKDVQMAIAPFQRTSGYTVTFGGESEQMKESFDSLRFALIFALVLVYMVIAAQLESFWQPIIIFVTVPLSVIGIAFALLLTGTSLNAVVLLGVILLGGIVVNNGIVLIDFINQLKSEGVPTREAALRAAETRMRPILMTTMTGVLGLLPLALGIGEGSELRSPMAITVIGGMTVSTILTLGVMPMMYETAETFFEKGPGHAFKAPSWLLKLRGLWPSYKKT